MVEYKNPGHTVIIIIESKENGKLVLTKRGIDPFKGHLLFPGGFVEYEETVEHAAERESMEEAGVKIKLKEILGVYSKPDRDPRGHNISTVFIAEALNDNVKAGDDAEEAFLAKPEEIDVSKLGFDHPQIFKDYLVWKKKKGTYWSGKSKD
ncbi:MAG: NUDIX hydrolase [Candidatus Micrarchaeota archaeon]